jgi:transcription elongation factor Elf1
MTRMDRSKDREGSITRCRFMGRRVWEIDRRFRIDLTEIEGDGDFYCPACGKKISPDDYSGLNYCILDVKTKVDGRVEEAIVQCRMCGSIICLDGFDLLEDLSCADEYFNIEEYLSKN